MKELLERHPFILTEASVVERLRRSKKVQLDPILANTPLIYNQEGRQQMAKIYREYLEVADNASVPIVLMTPTWRTNAERVKNSGCPKEIHRDVVLFMRKIIAESATPSVLLGGMMGCKNDCYRPQEALLSE